MKDLREAARAVVERWELPLWKDAPHTGAYISALREALAAAEAQPTPSVEPWSKNLDLDTATPAQPAPAGWKLVPEVPTEAMLRPFYECPPDELKLAWQAMLAITEAAERRVAAPAAPAQAPLTDEQIEALAIGRHYDVVNAGMRFDRIEFARAIECAHGIKGTA